jgi:hypothetical protein
MYIEFRLPNGAGGMAAGHAAHVIRKEIAEWADKYSITYKTKVHKYTLRLCLESDDAYTHFQLSWNPKIYTGDRYSIVYPDGHGRS